MRCRKGNQSLEVIDGAVDKDALGVMAWRVARKDSIGAGGEDEDVVRDDKARGGGDGFGGGLDGSNESGEVVG